MESPLHACIASIAGRLISGKGIGSLHDLNRFSDIDTRDLPPGEPLKEFTYLPWRVLGDEVRGRRFQCSLGDGQTVDLSVHGNSFIGFIRETSRYFSGEMRGEMITIFDQDNSVYISYRVTSFLSDMGDGEMDGGKY